LSQDDKDQVSQTGRQCCNKMHRQHFISRITQKLELI